MSVRAKRAALIIAMLLLLVLMVVLFRIAAANIYASKVYESLSLNRFDLHAISLDIESALSLNPSQPDYQLVRTHLLPRTDDADLKSLLVQYREQVKMRPAWPYAWQNLVMAKADLGEFDQEFDTALMQSMHTAPWSRDIHLVLTRVVLSSWGELSEVARKTALLLMERGLLTQPKLFIEMLRDHNKILFACAVLPAKQRDVISCENLISHDESNHAE
jgi:hypothetical protein